MSTHQSSSLDQSSSHSEQVQKLPPATPTYILRGHASAIHALDFYLENSRLASGDADGWIVVWSLMTKRPVAAWKAHDGAILGVQAVDFRRAEHASEIRVYTYVFCLLFRYYSWEFLFSFLFFSFLWEFVQNPGFILLRYIPLSPTGMFSNGSCFILHIQTWQRSQTPGLEIEPTG